jgi:nitroreductase/dihydropteridine reductase
VHPTWTAKQRNLAKKSTLKSPLLLQSQTTKAKFDLKPFYEGGILIAWCRLRKTFSINTSIFKTNQIPLVLFFKFFETYFCKMKHQILEDLNWRYATKKYDNSKQVSSEHWQIILDSLRLTPTSYGLYPLHFIVVESENTRSLLREKAWGQSQITDAAKVLVLCIKTDVNATYIDQHILRTAKIRNQDPEKIKGYGEFVKKQLILKGEEEIIRWNEKQAYIALGQLMHTCASLRIDATPMEGFEPESFDDILGLKEKNLKSVLVCAIGYRSEEDGNQHLPKIRKDLDEIVEVV